jgi:hypothetical protein
MSSAFRSLLTFCILRPRQMYATTDPVAVDGFILKSHANVFCGYLAGYDHLIILDLNIGFARFNTLTVRSLYKR